MNRSQNPSAAGREPVREPQAEATADHNAPLYVITLAASVAPMPLRGPDVPQLAGLAVFRSRQLEDGRERFRLHIGYFATEADAERVLPLVRDDYPAAIAALAPENSLGSLDDTAVARFSILRPVGAPAAPAKPILAAPVLPPAPAPAPAKVVQAAAAALTPARPPALVQAPARPVAVAAIAKTPLPARPVVPPLRPGATAAPRPAAASAPRAQTSVVPPPAPKTRASLEPPRTPSLAGRSAASAPSAPTFNGQAAAEVASPPTFGGRPATEVPRPAVTPPPAAAQEDAAPRDAQHYAVQLLWNNGPIDLDKIPVLAIFSGYLLYAVESEPGPRRFYGVRLGFYADALSARLVAQYVRSEFKSVAVVPVSQREMTRASTAAIRLSASRRVVSSSTSRSRWPSSALAVDPAYLRRAFTPGVN